MEGGVCEVAILRGCLVDDTKKETKRTAFSGQTLNIIDHQYRQTPETDH